MGRLQDWQNGIEAKGKNTKNVTRAEAFEGLEAIAYDMMAGECGTEQPEAILAIRFALMSDEERAVATASADRIAGTSRNAASEAPGTGKTKISKAERGRIAAGLLRNIRTDDAKYLEDHLALANMLLRNEAEAEEILSCAECDRWPATFSWLQSELKT